jgi:organic hydroperoxide reductase OsmC/OhrA
VKPYPHRYSVSGEMEGAAPVRLAAPGLPGLESAPPTEFDGPGDRWSPETLLVGAVVDCFLLTFRAVARASKYDWTRLHAQAEGVLDRAEGTTRFTEIRLRAALDAPAGADAATGERLLAKAEKGCLVSNSLKCPVHLEATVRAGS